MMHSILHGGSWRIPPDATVTATIRSGIARGIFSMNLAWVLCPIVAAAAKDQWPAEQGLISMTGTFIDTIIICTMTGLGVVSSGLWNGDLNGASLTNGAFAQAFPSFGNYLVTICLALFAFTTILGWNSPLMNAASYISLVLRLSSHTAWYTLPSLPPRHS